MTNLLFDGLLAGNDTANTFAETHDGRIYRYNDVMQDSARFANLLIERGVKPGDRVAVQVPKSVEALMLYLGTVRAGGVFLPLNTAYTVTEIEYFLNNATPRILVCDPARVDEYNEPTGSRGITLETLGATDESATATGSLAQALANADHTFENASCNKDDLAAILYTSGTTGRSKGAMLTHNNLLSNAKALVDCWQLTADDILLHALPIFHTHGLFVATNAILLASSSMLFLPGFDADKVIEGLPRATTMMGVPTFYTRLLEDPRLTGELVAPIRLFISGSAPLLAETHVAFEARTGKRILERYGMTETSIITSNPYTGERRAGTVGFPLPGVEIRITDAESGEIITNGETGSVEVKGPNVFKGYWQMPDKTQEDMRDDGFFITGDLGRIDEDGYLHIVGRAKDLIISGGYNIYPKELELLIDDIEGVQESAVFGVPHPDFGEGVVGVLVPTNGYTLREEDILEMLKGKVARFKQPKRLYLIDSLPRNTMGKVQKNILREQYKDTFSV